MGVNADWFPRIPIDSVRSKDISGDVFLNFAPGLTLFDPYGAGGKLLPYTLNDAGVQSWLNMSGLSTWQSRVLGQNGTAIDLTQLALALPNATRGGQPLDQLTRILQQYALQTIGPLQTIGLPQPIASGPMPGETGGGPVPPSLGGNAPAAPGLDINSAGFLIGLVGLAVAMRRRR